MFIVIHTERTKVDKKIVGTQDHWSAVETIEEAEAKYAALLLCRATYTASICKVIKSTDYEGEESASA